MRGCSFYKACEGATAIEYCFLIAGIALMIAVTVFAAGDVLADLFGDLPALFTGGG